MLTFPLGFLQKCQQLYFHKLLSMNIGDDNLDGRGTGSRIGILQS